MSPEQSPLDLDGAGLDALDAAVRRDLGFLNYPPANWLPATRGPAGEPVADVVIVGAGMCGLVAAFALRRAGIANMRVLDRAPAGYEGPWDTYARMETLRSPKQLLGPAYGMASLSFQAWYRAQFGLAAWDELFRIPRRMWMDYLRWYRRILDIPVENGVEVKAVTEGPAGLVSLDTGDKTVLARRLVLANGRDGLGRPSIPDFVAPLPRERWAHSSDDIDFAALAGRRVVVIGVGASAVDNAATALEAGASEVRMLARRKVMPTVNKLMGVGSYGLTAGWPAMTPDWRWRFMDYSARSQTPAPRNSTQRVSRNANAYFHFGCAIAGMEPAGDGVTIRTLDGRRFDTDFVILGTGFAVDTLARPELAAFAGRIATWADRYTPPPAEANPGLGTYPWLADDFSFTEKAPGTAPLLSKIHCFNFGASISLGKVSGDIPAISEGAQWLSRGLAAAFWNDDVEYHWAAVQAYSKPELLGDEWTDADAAIRDLADMPAARAV
jgi:cation diffusion facilitator CzcD-associated flavoprotein CzcO